ncbi:MAG: class IV adenylate cyclase [Candidatus Aminicenantes bacterium]|nr:class IV adenylate cyclase [Candidatus Aminicenantes bacterium]
MLEIEVKIPTEDLTVVRARLLELGAVVLQERHREENTLYDFRTGDLSRRREALRLRTRGRKAELTFKGPPLRSRRFKVRREFETEVRKPKQAMKILKSLGFVPVFQYSKHRAVLKIDRVRVCLDETAAGNFLELEGERNRIMALAKKLGMSPRSMIKKNYVELLAKT